MGNSSLLQPQWQIKKLLICHIIAITLLALWSYPFFHDLAYKIDIIFFKVLNGSLESSYLWASLWAVMSSRFFDFIVAIILTALVIRPDWLYSAKVVRQAFFALFSILVLQVIIRILFTKFIHYLGWQHASPSISIDGTYRLSDHFPFLEQKLEIKDSSKRSFPGDHASVLLAWAFFISLFARKFSQLFLIWIIAIIFMIPRLIAGAHWLSDDYVGGLFLAILAIAWGIYTPFAYNVSNILIKITLPLFRFLKLIPWINRFAIVRYPEK